MVFNFQNTATESPQNILPLWSTTARNHWLISFSEAVPSLTTVRVAVLWWRRLSFCHVRLGVNFMSWSNFCVLVWLSVAWRDFITLSDIIWTCGHVMDDVITMVVTWIMVWFFSVLDEIFVLVGFCLSWCDFIPWCNQPNLKLVWFFSVLDEIFSWWDFVCLGVILFLGAVNRILVWFFFVLDTMFVLARLYFFWCRFVSWCDQLHLGMIFLHFTRLFRLSVILFDLV